MLYFDSEMALPFLQLEAFFHPQITSPIIESVKNNVINKLVSMIEEKGKMMQTEIIDAKEMKDSIGGTIECAIIGVPAGFGGSLFDGIESKISACVFGIPAVKGIEFGSGFGGSKLYGSENNDAFYYDNDKIKTRTNNHGGILGGISSSMPIIFNVAIKPTPSIGKEQDSVSIVNKTNTKLTINGRHDPCIVQRAVPCIEAAAAISIFDLLY